MISEIPLFRHLALGTVILAALGCDETPVVDPGPSRYDSAGVGMVYSDLN